MAGSNPPSLIQNPIWGNITLQAVDGQGNVTPFQLNYLEQSQFNSLMQRLQGAIVGVSGQQGTQAGIYGPLSLNGNTISDIINTSPVPGNSEALSYGTANQLFGVWRGSGTVVYSNYTMQATDGTVLSNANGLTIGLPTLNVLPWHIYAVLQIAAGSCTVAAPAGQTLNGASSQPISGQYGAMACQFDGANWWIIAGIGSVGGSGVTSLNSLTGALDITAGAGVTVTPSGHNIQIGVSSGGAVTSINGESGALTLAGGPNISVANAGPAFIVQTAAPPGARVYNSGNESISSGVATALTFDSEQFDTHAVHSVVSNTSQLVAVQGGVYTICGNVLWAGNSSGERTLQIRLNGSSILAGQQEDSVDTNPLPQAVATVYKAQVMDYFELVVTQTSGGPLNVEF